MLAVLALLALALSIGAAWSYRSARRALAARLAREFAGILDAIDNVVGSHGDVVVTRGDAFSLNGALHPASPTIADASWRLLLGSQRTATFEAFLEAARVLNRLDGDRSALFSTDFGRSGDSIRGQRPARDGAWRCSASEPEGHSLPPKRVQSDHPSVAA